MDPITWLFTFGRLRWCVCVCVFVTFIVELNRWWWWCYVFSASLTSHSFFSNNFCLSHSISLSVDHTIIEWNYVIIGGPSLLFLLWSYIDWQIFFWWEFWYVCLFMVYDMCVTWQFLHFFLLSMKSDFIIYHYRSLCIASIFSHLMR